MMLVLAFNWLNGVKLSKLGSYLADLSSLLLSFLALQPYWLTAILLIDKYVQISASITERVASGCQLK